MSVIHEQGRSAAGLIRQILDFSRKSVAEQEPLDLAPLLKETVKMLQRTIPESIEIVTELHPGDHVVKADLTQMQQVLTNLAVNAEHAMPEGGELRFALATTEFAPGEPRPFPDMPAGTWVKLTVTDTGTGMPPQVLEHVFEPFFTTKEPGKGTGLGLAQVYGIVKQHSGFIDGESEVDRGTTFTLYLPPLQQPAVVVEEAIPATAALGRGEMILVVEDEPQVRQFLADALDGLGYRVLTAENGEEALEVYDERAAEIALVLTDLTMPKMGGVELFRRLRERALDVKVMVLTGYPVEDGGRALLDQGIVAWMQKPPELKPLAEAVRKALESRPPA